MRAQSPRRAPTGDLRSRACRPTRTTTRPWRRCSRAASSAIWTGTRNSAPCRTSCSSTAASRTRASPSACARRCTCTCRSSAWSRTTATARALVTAQGREIDLHAAPNVFALIGQIQEETHRFAITFHHESHSRSSTRSALDGIPGVGKVRAQALLKTFKSVRAIREADIFALERVLPKDAAASVYLHFHGETDEKEEKM